jgi:hypothetical protein
MFLLFGALGSCFEAAFKRIGQKRNCGVYASVFLQKKKIQINQYIIFLSPQKEFA